MMLSKLSPNSHSSDHAMEVQWTNSRQRLSTSHVPYWVNRSNSNHDQCYQRILDAHHEGPQSDNKWNIWATFPTPEPTRASRKSREVNNPNAAIASFGKLASIPMVTPESEWYRPKVNLKVFEGLVWALAQMSLTMLTCTPWIRLVDDIVGQKVTIPWQ